MKRLRAPRSLVARMTWLVAGVGLLSLVLHVAVVALWMNELSEELSGSISGRVHALPLLLKRTPAPERAALAAGLSSERVRVGRIDKLERGITPPLPAGAQGLINQLQRQLGPDVQVSVPPTLKVDDRGWLLFDMRVDDEVWRVGQRLQPPLAGLLGTGIGWLVLLALTVFASLALGVRLIARPVSSLAEKLAASGHRIEPLPEPPGIATELQTLVTAFNRLAVAVQQADADRQHLLAGVSHDLRTPLARLKLRIETELDDEPRAESMLAEVAAIERIVSQFLAYVQGDVVQQLGEPDDVAELVRRTVAACAAQGHAVEMTAGSVESRLPDIALQRILTNLVDNALAHGEPPVLVSLSQRAGPQRTEAVLSVADHGLGLDAESFERALQPFVRLAPPDAENTLGHCGLGLAIVAQLARAIGARIEAGRDAEQRFAVILAWPVDAPTSATAAPR